ncbi:hypothetical protein AVEN_13357-1 [Araneus ventricosus]|uniref:Uncharacterized protein n=1 Tax=Araneus ventricosus TaxID=182803 RepID=A0A4Y2T5J4_ARAVE|nr:hypothetical protein AVEN_13357-1 [Araneus ventricosus]
MRKKINKCEWGLRPPAAALVGSLPFWHFSALSPVGWAGPGWVVLHPTSRRTFGFHAYGLACTRPINAADLQWNRVSSLEPSGLQAETLAQGHPCPL